MAAPTPPDLSDLASPGTEITLRATPRARRPGITRDGGDLRVAVTAPAEDGKANEAVREALAKALGIAKTRLTLLRGQTARTKTFRVD